jgi:hypothetical protein
MVLLGVVILLPLAYSVVTSLFAEEVQASHVVLEKPDPRFEKCIRETTYMRYHHWELLREARKSVVRYGTRDDTGLYKCKECHTSRERFCDRCHVAVSLHPDCWGCHNYP